MTREIGAALAVLALYVLVLLAPLHQAAGLERDLARLGFESVGTWSVCASAAEDDRDTGLVVGKCAAAGIGKHDLLPPDLPPSGVPSARSAVAVAYPPAAAPFTPARAGEQGRARAPPVTV